FGWSFSPECRRAPSNQRNALAVSPRRTFNSPQVQHTELVPCTVDVRFLERGAIRLQRLRQPTALGVGVASLSRAPRQPMQNGSDARRRCLPHPVHRKRELQPLLPQSEGSTAVEVWPLTIPIDNSGICEFGDLPSLNVRELAKISR